MSGLAIGIVLVGGFAAAAQQHFAAHQHSVRNVELQRERDRLRNERQRLLLKREAALSPAQLEKKAQKIGMRTPSAEQINQLPGNTTDAIDSEKSF
jgi:cell division protein FtsL